MVNTKEDRREDVIFERRADKTARAILIKGDNRKGLEAIPDFVELPNRVAALLMHHEGVCFSVYGENMMVPVLIKAFGPQGLNELVQQGAVRFWLRKTGVMYLTQPRPGVMPLVSSAMSSETHRNPEESVAESFRRSTLSYEARFLKRFKEGLVQAYVDPGHSFAPHAVDFGHQGYSLGRFEFAGLTPDVPLEELDTDRRAKLADIATEMHDLSLIANLKMNTVDEFAIARVCHDSVDRLRRGGRLEAACQRAFEIENVPDLATLFRTGKLSVRDVPKLRMKPDVVRFRKLMRQVSSKADADDAGSAYLDAIAGNRSFWSTTGGRIIKTLSVSAFTGTVGGAVGGFVGAAVGVVGGAASAPMADAAVGKGLDLFDEFVLGALLSGWQPRNYFQNVIFPNL